MQRSRAERATSSYSVAYDDRFHRMQCVDYSKKLEAVPQVFPHSSSDRPPPSPLLPPKTGSLSSQEKYWPSTLPTLWFPEKAGRKLPNLVKVVTLAHICASPAGHDHIAPTLPRLCLQIQGKNQDGAAPRLTLETWGNSPTVFI